VFLKEWRRLLRASSTPWALAVYVVVPAVVAALYLKTAYRNPAGLMAQMVPLMGAQALSNVGAWQILLLAVWAPWLSAGMLAGEVEERTLDPFLAGGGRLFSAVFGKLAAVLSFFGLVIAAGLPAFALPMLIGGINWGLMGRVAALEGATVLLMAGLGLALSGFSRRSGSVVLAGVALGLALTLGTALAGSVLAPAGPDFRTMPVPPPGIVFDQSPAAAQPKWLLANPLVGLTSALDSPVPTLLQLRGNWTGPIYREFRLWQLQLAGAGAAAMLSAVVAWLAMTVRLRWRRPLWLFKWRRRKAVAMSG